MIAGHGMYTPLKYQHSILDYDYRLLSKLTEIGLLTILVKPKILP